MCQTTNTQQQQTTDIENSLKTPVSILKDTSGSDSKRHLTPKSILRDTSTTDSRQTTTKSILKNSNESSYLPVTQTETDPNSSYKNSTSCSVCTMISIFLTFALVLGWFAMLAHGFEVASPTPVRRPHMATANLRSFDWTLGATNFSGDDEEDIGISRRSAMAAAATTLAVAASCHVVPAVAAPRPNGLILSTAPTSGLRWADAKVGTGEVPSPGAMTSIDYSMASTAGRFPTIYTTKNGDEPYRWRMGDGSTIKGIELAILGDSSEGIPPMRPGGIRRVIVPNNMGYNSLIGRDDANNVILGSDQSNLSPAAKNQRCLAGAENSLGPIPPKEAPDGAYQRWYQFYCNPRIPYQPDLVLDIKLYGKRA